MTQQLYETEEERQERALLISVDTGEFDAAVSLEELAELAATAGAAVVDTAIQKKETPDKATCLGSGRAEELALRCAAEIYHTLGSLLHRRGLSTAVGDEGGFAPDLPSDDAALEIVSEAIIKAGYDTERVKIALDAASGEWFDAKDSVYRMPKRGLTYDRSELCGYWETLVKRFPVCSLEDGLDQRDFEGWATLTQLIGHRVMLVGDDLFVTNTARLAEGIKKGAANAVLVKPNQIGTLGETLDLIAKAENAGYSYILSHRSGETEDTALADIAVGTRAPFIKTGAPCRGERVSKYNRLTAIAAELGSAAVYGIQPD